MAGRGRTLTTRGRLVQPGSVHELVAEAAHRQEIHGAVWVLLDLAPQAFHVDIERLRVPEVVGSPYLVDEEVAGQQPALDRKSTRLNSSHPSLSRMPSSA